MDVEAKTWEEDHSIWWKREEKGEQIEFYSRSWRYDLIYTIKLYIKYWITALEYIITW